jgi:hypothetical protein
MQSVRTIQEFNSELDVRNLTRTYRRGEFRVKTDISGGTPNLIGKTLVPIPVATNNVRPSSMINPLAYLA